MSTEPPALVDVSALSGETLRHLAALADERERRQAERRALVIARISEGWPVLGAFASPKRHGETTDPA